MIPKSHFTSERTVGTRKDPTDSILNNKRYYMYRAEAPKR
jgi:hypothetical protein